LKYTRTASAKLKIIQKILTKNEKYSKILFPSMQYTNFTRKLRNSITQEREFIAQWQQKN